MFDLKKHPWFIRVSNKEETRAAQQWLFKNGIAWQAGETLLDFDFRHLLTNKESTGTVRPHIMWTRDDTIEPKRYPDSQEIELTFEYTVKDAKFPDLETANQKKIRKLRDRVKGLQAEIDELLEKELEEIAELRDGIEKLATQEEKKNA